MRAVAVLTDTVVIVLAWKVQGSPTDWLEASATGLELAIVCWPAVRVLATIMLALLTIAA